MAKNDSGSGMLWFFTGAVVGASVAFFYAPKTGRETRKYISENAGKSKETLTESGKELVERGKDLYDRGRAIADEAADLFERGRKLVKG
jgi:gas vesicle protein